MSSRNVSEPILPRECYQNGTIELKRDNHILQNESYSRRKNLLFRGYTTRNNDTESCEDKVRHIMTVMGIQNVQNIKIVRCHYLNEQKQIIARF